jgi:hypothetical protein
MIVVIYKNNYFNFFNKNIKNNKNNNALIRLRL